VAAADAPPRDGCNQLAGIVTTIGFQGEQMRYGIDAGGIALQAMGAYRTHFARGDAVTLQFSADATLGLLSDSTPVPETLLKAAS
jgi:hypothetical protein